MAKTAIATAAETTLANVPDGEDVLAALGEDFDFTGDTGFGFDQRFQIPAIKFNDDDHPGQLYNKTTEEGVEAMNVVFLYAQQYRDYSVTEDEGKTYQRICSSSDTRLGVGMIEATGEERKCKTCPHARWSEKEGKRVKPDCNEGFGVVGMDLDTEALFLMRFQVTGYAAFGKLRAKYHGPQKIGQKRVRELPLWMRRYRVSVKKAEGKKYYLPVIEPLKPALIAAGQARDVFDSAKLVEENFGQVMSFHRDPDTDGETNDAIDTTADYAGDGSGYE